MTFVNITAYKFVPIAEDQLTSWPVRWRDEAGSHSLKGTILLSTEGINFMLAGQREGVESFKNFIATHDDFNDLHYKESFST